MVKKVKDRNESTDLLLRGFNCELLENLKSFTCENTGSKAIKVVCSRYLMLEKMTSEQIKRIHELEQTVREMKRLYNTVKEASSELSKLMQG